MQLSFSSILENTGIENTRVTPARQAGRRQYRIKCVKLVCAAEMVLAGICLLVPF